MAGDGHEGWANYETWLVNLHLTNNESAYQECMSLARATVYAAEPLEHLADGIKDYVERPFGEMDLTYDLGSNVAVLGAELLRSALGEVDWIEIANSFDDMVAEEKTLREKHARKS